ncbi:ATP-binding protein [Shewanella sp. 10N.286.51.B8]|uniref:ATP-binding protein n=1 Tax=Shewanella sp. 10N.286.51.B8 TaxID=3229708 RepID=UPI00354BC1E4
MNDISTLISRLGESFGVLAESNTSSLNIVARNSDIAVGDLFLIPSQRGEQQRVYIFRATEYANVLNRSMDMSDIARNKLTMPGSYFSDNLADEKLIAIRGILLGYSEYFGNSWEFHRPRRLPEHLTDVYHISAGCSEKAEVLKELLVKELPQDGIYLGDFLAGETALPEVKICLPAFALSHHIGIFGRTGVGKSNMMMVLIKGVLDYNRRCHQSASSSPKASFMAIDPHDEFLRWHASSGGADGVRAISEHYSDEEKEQLIAPFYYLSAKELPETGFEQKVSISRADITPEDLFSIAEFTEQQMSFASRQFAVHGEQWIGRSIMGDTGNSSDVDEEVEYMQGTVTAVQRRLGFLHRGNTRIVTNFDPDFGDDYTSQLPDILCALEAGRVLVIDTSLMSEMEQFLFTTVVARTLFTLRKAIRSVESVDLLPNAIRLAFGNDDDCGQVGLACLVEALIERLNNGSLPYIQNGSVIPPNQLPYVNIVIEEAPSILNPQRMRFGSVFRDISRQGRKFGIGLSVISQQVSEIDAGVLTQINTELIMALGNEGERREAIKNASIDMQGFERELQVMGKGQVIVTASYKDMPLPVQVPDFDFLEQ